MTLCGWWDLNIQEYQIRNEPKITEWNQDYKEISVAHSKSDGRWKLDRSVLWIFWKLNGSCFVPMASVLSPESLLLTSRFWLRGSELYGQHSYSFLVVQSCGTVCHLPTSHNYQNGYVWGQLYGKSTILIKPDPAYPFRNIKKDDTNFFFFNLLIFSCICWSCFIIPKIRLYVLLYCIRFTGTKWMFILFSVS